jgi:hypothetical protein
MERGLLFFTLSLLCLWAILDEFYGGKKLSDIAFFLTPASKKRLADVWKDDDQANRSKEEAKEKIDKSDDMTDDAKDKLKDAIDKFWEPSKVH